MPAGNEEAGQHDDRGREGDPKGQHVQHREGHVSGTDHEGNQEITEGPHEDGHDHEEDHDRGVHGKHGVIGFRRNDAAKHKGFGNPTEAGHRRFGPSELPAHEQGQ
jgi:hypothetical protein